MKMILSAALLSLLFTNCFACDSAPVKMGKEEKIVEAAKGSPASATHWKGSFSNGMKGATISFDVEGNEVKNLTFQGYWRCDGKLELTKLGPGKGYTIKGKAVDGTIKESGFYFELHGTFDGSKASGALRFAFVSGGCDAYKLDWTAKKQ